MLFVSSSGHGKRTPLDAFNRQGRGGQGVRGMQVTEARGRGRRRVHGDARRRDPGVLLGRQYHPHGRRRDLGAGPGRHRRARRPARRGRYGCAVAPVLEAEQSDDDDETPATSPARARSPDAWRAPRRCSRRVPANARHAPRRREAAAAPARASPRSGLRAPLPPDHPLGRPLVGAEDLDVLLPVRADRDARRRGRALVDRVGGRRRAQRREVHRRARERQGLPLPVVGGAARRDAHRARSSCACSSSSPCSRPRSTTCSPSCSAASRSPSSSTKTRAEAGRIRDRSWYALRLAGAIAQSVRAHP